MTRDLLPTLLTAAALLATPLGTLHAAGEDTTRMGAATGVTFSGYTKDADGRRLWSLAADKASPLTGEETGRNNWALKTVRIRIFDRLGRAALNVNAPSAKYFGDIKTALEKGSVTAEGDGLHISGTGWKWVNGENNSDAITLDSKVRVRITPPADSTGKNLPILITADRLRAVTDNEGTTALAFEGNVRMTRDKATLTCEKLSTRVHGAARVGTDKPTREDIEVIDAEGNVTLVNAGMSISGKTARVLPAENQVSVIGDAEFRDFENNRIRVNGSAMHFDQTTRRIRVDPTGDARDGRVTAELPCLDERRAKNIRFANERARVSGKNLEILIGDTSNTLFITGDVKLVDPDYLGSCERFTIESARESTGARPEFMSVDARGVVVTRIIAEEKVMLMRDGRTLHCGKAEISPRKGLVELTQSPRVDDPRNGAALVANRMTIDSSANDTTVLFAYGEPAAPVVVTLPSLRRNARPGPAPAATTVTGELLVVTRRADLAVFEFENDIRLTGESLTGSCDRLGIEVNSGNIVRGASAASRIRRAVAVGNVQLKQDADTAEAPRAELYPNARLRELTVGDDNGLDGKEPLYIALDLDEEVAPGRRPKITAPSATLPSLDGKAGAPADAAATMSVEADHQELIKGEERLRAFARGRVVLSGKNISGTAADTEILATKVAATGRFEADILVARGGVTLRFDDRNASADTLEILARQHRIILTGNPKVDGMPSAGEIGRKIIEWTPGVGSDFTRLKIIDEPRTGYPTQIIRPRIELPGKGVPDLGRSLKNLDKNK